MQGCTKRATYNVNQMGEFWCFFILTSEAGNFNRGRLKRVLLYMEIKTDITTWHMLCN
jgi:hypothetical protein